MTAPRRRPRPAAVAAPVLPSLRPLTPADVAAEENGDVLAAALRRVRDAQRDGLDVTISAARDLARDYVGRHPTVDRTARP